MRSSVYYCAGALLAGAILLSQPRTDVENRVNSLLARMTIDDKIGQMSQSTAMATPISDGIKAEIRAGRWGSFLNAGSPADRAEAQRIAMTESRLHEHMRLVNEPGRIQVFIAPDATRGLSGEFEYR